MPPFSQNGTISAILGATETIEILQPLINFFDKDLSKNEYLVNIYEKIWYFSGSKPLMCIALAQTCLFYFLKQVFFGRMRGK